MKLIDKNQDGPLYRLVDRVIARIPADEMFSLYFLGGAVLVVFAWAAVLALVFGYPMGIEGR